MGRLEGTFDEGLEDGLVLEGAVELGLFEDGLEEEGLDVEGYVIKYHDSTSKQEQINWKQIGVRVMYH